MYSFPNLETVHCSMSSSSCCFLTCIQVSQEADMVVWYSHLLKNFPQFIVIHTVEGFGIVNKAEIDVFLKLSCFLARYSYCHEVMGPDAMISVFWMLSFKPAFKLYSFTFIKRLFSSSSLSAIKVVLSAYLRLLIFLPAILIPVCASSSPAFQEAPCLHIWGSS